MDARPYRVLPHSVPAAYRRVEAVVPRLAVPPHELRIAQGLLQPRYRPLPCHLHRHGGLSWTVVVLHGCAVLPVLSHVLGGKLVALLHQRHLIIDSARLPFPFFQLGGQLLHLPFQLLLFPVHLRFLVERAELTVDVPVGGNGRTAAAAIVRIVPERFPFRLAVRQFHFHPVHIALFGEGEVLQRAHLLRLLFLRLRLLVGFPLVADDPVILRQGDVGVERPHGVPVHVPLLRRCEYQPHRAEEQQAHQRIYHQLLPLLQLFRRERLGCLLLLFPAALVLLLSVPRLRGCGIRHRHVLRCRCFFLVLFFHHVKNLWLSYILILLPGGFLLPVSPVCRLPGGSFRSRLSDAVGLARLSARRCAAFRSRRSSHSLNFSTSPIPSAFKRVDNTVIG